MDILGSLPYMNACIEEGLRIFPPVPISLLRTVPKEGSMIDGYMVPGGVSNFVYADGRCVGADVNRLLWGSHRGQRHTRLAVLSSLMSSCQSDSWIQRERENDIATMFERRRSRSRWALEGASAVT